MKVVYCNVATAQEKSAVNPALFDLLPTQKVVLCLFAQPLRSNSLNQTKTGNTLVMQQSSIVLSMQIQYYIQIPRYRGNSNKARGKSFQHYSIIIK